jgi:hypothetical protein
MAFAPPRLKVSGRKFEPPAFGQPPVNSGFDARGRKMKKNKSSRLADTAMLATMLMGCAGLPGLASAAPVSHSAHSNIGAGNLLANATLGNYGGSGLGVSGAGENGAPQHAVDNNGGIDAVRITFSDSVRLTGVTFGWAWSGSSNDTDFSVLYSTGATPCLTGNLYAALSGCGGGNNWTLLNNYNSNGTGLKNLSNTTVFARNWLLVAYGAFGNNCVNIGTNGNGCDAGDEYFKLSSVQCVERVPEPGTLALPGLGIAGLGLTRRRRT